MFNITSSFSSGNSSQISFKFSQLINQRIVSNKVYVLLVIISFILCIFSSVFSLYVFLWNLWMDTFENQHVSKVGSRQLKSFLSTILCIILDLGQILGCEEVLLWCFTHFVVYSLLLLLKTIK